MTRLAFREYFEAREADRAASQANAAAMIREGWAGMVSSSAGLELFRSVIEADPDLTASEIEEAGHWLGRLAHQRAREE